MTNLGLKQQELELIRAVLRAHPEVAEAKMFGSRAKGNSRPNSDVDLALWGEIPFSVLATISGELDELPLPYKFDVQDYSSINHVPLREHIDRVGQSFYKKGMETPA